MDPHCTLFFIDIDFPPSSLLPQPALFQDALLRMSGAVGTVCMILTTVSWKKASSLESTPSRHGLRGLN